MIITNIEKYACNIEKTVYIVIARYWVKWKLYVMTDPNAITRHHIISQCRRGKYHIEERCNIVKMKWRRHNALHMLFQSHTPRGQLKELYKIYKGVLSPLAKQRFRDLFETQLFYKKELYRPHQMLKARSKKRK